MNNHIVNNEHLSKIVSSTANMLNKFIDELGLSSSLSVVITTNDMKSNKKRRYSQKGKIEKSIYINDVNKMLLNGVRYEDISVFLKSKGEDISKACVGRYSIKFFNGMNENKPPREGGVC